MHIPADSSVLDDSHVAKILEDIKQLGYRFEWEWDEENHVYVDTVTGEIIYHDTMIEYRNDVTLRAADRFSRYPLEEDEEPEGFNWTALLLLGLIGLGVWEAGMRQGITATVVTEYALGRGGFEQLGDADWDVIDEILLTQFQFLNAFSIAISLGELSEWQIVSRSRLYYFSTVQAFERGRAKSFDTALSLTVNPGDCTSVCCANDKCFWLIIDIDDTIECSWVRTVLESCSTCVARESCPSVVFDKATGDHENMSCYEEA